MGITFNPLIFSGLDLTGSGSSGASIGGAVTGGTDKAVLFVHPANVLAQDETNFNYDPATHNLTITGLLAASNLSGTNTGNVTLTAVGSSPNANGASLSGQVLTLQPANVNNPGLLTILTQVIAGPKIFKDNLAQGTSNTFTSTASNSFVSGDSNVIGDDVSTGASSFACGTSNTASGDYSHAIGEGSTASGEASHSEGLGGIASGVASHAQGRSTQAEGDYSHAEGQSTTAAALASHAAGQGTIANANHQTVVGQFNVPIGTPGSPLSTDEVFSVGVGANSGAKATGFSVRRDGLIDAHTHLISNVLDPVSAQDAVTKNYADTIASQLNPLQGTYAGSTTNIVGTYLNGAAGIGATFTVTATGAFTIDGTTPPQFSRILIKDQTSGFQNGIYDLTVTGSLGISPILTRSLDYDTSSNVNAGDLIPVINGTVNTKTSWLQTATVTTMGTDPLVFVQWTANPSSYLLKTNNLSDVSNKTTSFNNLSPMTTGGDLIYGGSSGSGTRLANGTANQILQSNGTTLAPTWTTDITGNAGNVTGTVAIGHGGTGQTTKAPAFDALQPMTTGGDLIYGGASGTGTRLANGSSGQVLTSSGGTSAPTWTTVTTGSTGDISQTSFTAADNQSSAADVTGFLFSNASVRSFDALVSVTRSSTYSVYKLQGIQKAASWEMSQDLTGDTTGLVFTITNAGQVQYTSTSTGSTATVKFRAIVTNV